MSRRKPVDITEDQYERCFAARDSGETKKVQCEILGIAYNTKRLDTLLEEHVEKKEHRKRMRANMRKQPVTNKEIADWVLEYLQGESLVDISERSYRSQSVVKDRLAKIGVWGLMSHDVVSPLTPPLVNDELMSDSFEVGEIVFVPGYKGVGLVKHCYGSNNPEGVNQYRVHLAGDRERNIYCYAYDLGSLRPLKEAGVRIESLMNDAFMSKADITMLLAEALKKANMKPTDRK